MSDVMIIGLAGGTGSGKTTITRRLMQRFGADVSVIYHDNYYKEHHNMPYEERAKLNYDHPDAFDNELFIRAIRDLKAGKDVVCPVYDYSIHDRSDKTIVVKSAKVVIVEGILIYASKELRDLMDIKLFVDTDAARERDRPVSHDRQAHARAVRRAEQALCRPHHPRGRAQQGRDAHGRRARPVAHLRRGRITPYGQALFQIRRDGLVQVRPGADHQIQL